MKYKVVIFDQDGTVANTLELIAMAMSRTLVYYTKKEYDKNDVLKCFLGPSEDGILQKLLPTKEMAESAFLHYVEEYRRLHDSVAPKPFDGIKEMLEHLHHSAMRVCMMTGKHAVTTDISMTKFGIRDYFEILVSGSPKGAVKVEALRKMVDDMGVKMSDCIYVGDEDRDINYCREINMSVASVAWAETAQPDILEKLNPGMVFYQPAALEKWLLE